MSYKQYSAIKVGIFVAFAIIIVIGTIFWAKSFYLNKGTKDCKVYFDNVTGLKQGDPVLINGVRKGKVLNFDIEGDSVLVEFSIEEDIRIYIDYRIEIIATELLGGKMINITPGKEKQEIDYNLSMIGSGSNDMMALMSNFSDLAGDVKVLIGNFNKATIDLEKVLVNVNEIIGDPNTKKNLKSTVGNIEVASRNLNLLIAENRVSLKNLADKTGLTIDKFGNTMDNVNEFVDDTKPEIKNTFQDVQSLTEKVNTLVENLNVLVTDITEQKSGVGKFIYDDKFFDNLNNTLIEIEKLTKKIRDDGVKIDLF
ncbi:MAG: MCE family protein [Ignavibacteria bacterium]|nr:MCE family protein [Ignavibacteria bacterium]